MSNPRTSTETAAGAAPPAPALALPAHERWLRTVVRARVGEAQAVDEVMQEVALAAVAGRSAPADPARLGAWLYRVAVRQALLHRRRHGRRRGLVDRYAARLGPDAGRGPDDGPLGFLLRDERRELVRAALKRLPPRDAEVLVLKYTEGWTCRELAARLGVGPAAVEARLHRARARLRAELADPDSEVPGS